MSDDGRTNVDDTLPYTYLPTRAQYERLSDEHELALLAASELSDDHLALAHELAKAQTKLTLYEAVMPCGHALRFTHTNAAGVTLCLRCAYHEHDLDA